MVTDAMVRAAWCAMPPWMQDGADEDDVRRILAAAEAARNTEPDPVRVLAHRVVDRTGMGTEPGA